MFDVFMFSVVVVLHITLFCLAPQTLNRRDRRFELCPIIFKHDLIVDFDFFNKPRHQFTNHGREGK